MDEPVSQLSPIEVPVAPVSAPAAPYAHSFASLHMGDANPPAVSAPATPLPGIRLEAPPDRAAKGRILAAAVHLFCRRGYEAASVREIVEEAGVTKPVLYYYFKNKEELFQFIVSSTLKEYRENLEAICRRTDLDFRGCLEAVCELHFEAAKTAPELVRFVNAIAFSGIYNSLYDFESYWRGNMELVVRYFEQAHERGWVRADLSVRWMAFHFMSMVLGVMRGMAFSRN